MSKLSTILGGAIAGLALAVGVSLAGNLSGNNVAYANTTADKCFTTQDGITINDTHANTFVKVADGCGIKKVVMKSSFAPSSTGAPHDKQVLFDTGDITAVKAKWDTWTKVNVKMVPKGCFFQVDLVDVTDGATGGKNPVLVSMTGGNHDCTPTIVKPACTALGLTPGDNRTATISTFTVATGSNITLNSADINWGDGTVQNFPTALGKSHQWAADGEYTVTVTAHFTYFGQFGDQKTGDATCAAKIKFTTPPPEEKFIFVCELSTKKILNINVKDFGTDKYPLDKYTKDLSKCVVKKINVCDLTTKTVITINEEDFDASKHTNDLSKCVPPTTPPTTPPTLVNTGAGSTVALAGATAIVAAAAHAFWRRRNA
jgi:hypothetical protein